jgi:tetratricopeptide (TPR) repeat protein
MGFLLDGAEAGSVRMLHSGPCRLSVCLSACLSACLPAYRPACLPACLPTFLRARGCLNGSRTQVEDQGGEPRPDHDTYLLIGGNGSSVSFHAHADSIVAVLFGEKRWWLVPPGTRPRPRWRHPAGMATWAGSDAAQSVPEAVECVQMPGELLFVPESWHHATLNYGETVAVAQQSRVGSSLWLQLRLLGTQLVQSRAWADALEVLEETLRRYPAEPESYSALALLLMDILDPTPFTAGGGAPPALSPEQASSMWGRAEALLFQSLALDPNDSAVHTNLCKILTMQEAAKDGGDRGRLGHQRAATHCNRAVELDENRYARTYQYACTHCRKVAVASFEASACMPGVSFHAQFYSATQLATRGEHKRAVERFMIACALDKNSAEAHYQLSRSMLLQLDPERSSDAQKLLLRGTIAAGLRAAQLLCNRCRVNAPNPTQDCKCSGASTAEQTLSLLNSMDAETQQAVRVFNKPLATMLLSSDERREDAALRAEL